MKIISSSPPHATPVTAQSRLPDTYRDVVGRIAAGDRAAFAVLYDDFRWVVVGVGRQLLYEVREAEPMAEAVFVEAWHLAVKHRSDPSTLGWLLAITHRRCRERNQHPHASDTQRCPCGPDEDDHRARAEITDLLPAGHRPADAACDPDRGSRNPDTSPRAR